MDLSAKHQEMVKGLIELGVSEEAIALMLMMLPTEKQIVDLAKYLTEQVDIHHQEITTGTLLTYLMEKMKKLEM